MAEKEGFEPSIPFWGIHDFQSCALGQLRDFSMCRTAPQSAYVYYNTSTLLSSVYFTKNHCFCPYVDAGAPQKSVDIPLESQYNNRAE